MEQEQERRPRKTKKLNWDSTNGQELPQFVPISDDALGGRIKDIEILSNNGESDRTSRALLNSESKTQSVDPGVEESKLSARERKRIERREAKQGKKNQKKAEKESKILQPTGSTLKSVSSVERPTQLPLQSQDVAIAPTPSPTNGIATQDSRGKPDSKGTNDVVLGQGQSKKRKRKDVEHLVTSDTAHNVQSKAQKLQQSAVPSSQHAARFIAFIGNLPYTASTESIEKHFSKLEPFTIRSLTDKKTGKFRGCAFIEFGSYDKMELCLRMFHHSKFDDGQGGKRKINVELTAGGGGKSSSRMDKIREKNKKLKEERKKKVEEESKEKKDRQIATPSESNVERVAKAVSEVSGDTTIQNDGIHPSRRARIKK